MSRLRQGVLRAVRLLPEVVKIGIEPETALPSSQEEEPLLQEGLSPEGAELQGAASGGAPSVSSNASGASPASSLSSSNKAPGKAPVSEKKEKEKPKEKAKEKSKEGGDEAAKALKDLNDRIAALQIKVNEAGAVEQSLRRKISSLETEMSGVKNAAAQKERELTASVEAAREQARAEGKTQGYEEGLKNGHAAGLDKAKAESQAHYREKFSGVVATLEGVSAKLEENFAGLVELNQPRMLRLWQEMLKKMLRREMAMTPDSVLDVLSDILTRLSDKNRILIYVAPEDLELLQTRLQEEFEDVLRGAKHLELKPDTSVDKGSCLVETNLGVYDARWRTQLDQIEMSVEKLLQQMGKVPRPKDPPARLSQTQAAREETEEAIKEPEEEKSASAVSEEKTEKIKEEKAETPPEAPDETQAPDAGAVTETGEVPDTGAAVNNEAADAAMASAMNAMAANAMAASAAVDVK